MITSQQLKKKFLEFFKEKGHAIIPSASLIPENDPTVLFTTAGMHPLVPYLLWEKHPAGKRLTNVQKCIRTGDIEEVGDSWHLTFFEMLGNWSLGDYFKKEAIQWSWEFLTSKKWLGINPKRISVSVFAGDADAPFDQEAFQTWLEVGLPQEKIFKYGKAENWWGPAGKTGPCGPDTEMYYDTSKPECPQCKTKGPACECGKYAEIWNDVFMQYNKTAEGKYELLKQKNVDTGMGVERTIAVLNGKDNVFEVEPLFSIASQVTSLFNSSINKLSKGQLRAVRIIVDHLRAATFILAEGIEPSNVEKGYVLRRLIRRSIRYGKELGINDVFTFKIAETVIEEMKDDYPELKQNKDFIVEQLVQEEEKFEKAIKEGLKAAEKIFAKKIPIAREKFVKLMQEEDKTQILHQVFEKKRQKKPYNLTKFGISKKEFDQAALLGKESFYLYQSFGLPIEMILELVREKNLFVSQTDFRNEVKKHQQLSRTATAGKFKGGLADHSEQTKKLHTATHLLLAALRQILGDHVYQKGSNITPERLRLDFSHPERLTDEQKKKVEEIINEKIKENLPVTIQEMSLDEAKKAGAIGVFEHKYGERVKVYSIGDFSKEICGGPHMKNTGELGKFKILKEEASSAGVRRIKAVSE